MFFQEFLKMSHHLTKCFPLIDDSMMNCKVAFCFIEMYFESHIEEPDPPLQLCGHGPVLTGPDAGLSHAGEVVASVGLVGAGEAELGQ